MKQVWSLDGVDFVVAESQQQAISYLEGHYSMTLRELGHDASDIYLPDQEKPFTIDDRGVKQTKTWAEWAACSELGFLCSTEW